MGVNPYFISALIFSAAAHAGIVLFGIRTWGSPGGAYDPAALSPGGGVHFVEIVAQESSADGPVDDQQESEPVVFQPPPQAVLRQRPEQRPRRLQDRPGDRAGSGESREGIGTGEGPGLLLHAPKPPFPWAARLAGFEGSLELDAIVGTDGYVRGVTLVSSSGRDDCDSSALETVRSGWRFAPSSGPGKPQLWKERIKIRYALLADSG